MGREPTVNCFGSMQIKGIMLIDFRKSAAPKREIVQNFCPGQELFSFHVEF